MNTNSCILCGHNSEEKLSFHSFPSKAERRKEWLRLCNLDPNTIITNAHLCCKHFKEEDFKMSASGRQLLKRGTAPSVFFNEKYTEAPIENVPLSPAPKRGSNYNHTCIICGHSNGTSSYHRLPKNEQLRNKWFKHLNIDPADPKVNIKDPRLCGLHFVPYSGEGSHHRRRTRQLLPVEMVTIDLNDELVWTALDVMIDENSTDAEMNVDGEVVTEVAETNENLQFSVLNQEVETLESTLSALPDTPSPSLNRTKLPRYPNDIKSEDIERATPRTKRALQVSRDYIQKQKKTINKLQQQLRRTNKKIKSLEDMMQYVLETNCIVGQMEDDLLMNNFVESTTLENN